MAAQFAKSIKQIDEGKNTPLRAAVDFLPTALRRSVKMEFFDDGKVLDGSGNYVITPSTAERLAIYAGATPLSYRKEMAARAKAYEANDSDMAGRQARAAQINQALNTQGTMAAQQIIMQTASEYQMQPYQVAMMAATQKATRDFGPDIVDGLGPIAQQNNRLYPSINGPVNLQRVSSKMTSMDQLGLPMHNPYEAMSNAANLDARLELDPLMTVTAARRSLNPRNQFTPITSGDELPSLGNQAGGLGLW